MFSEFKIAVFLFLRERICSAKRICFLKNFLQVCVYTNKLFTPFRTYIRKIMSMTVLAIAGNFFLFIEVRERFQVAYGTFWIELFLACHRTFAIFLIRAGK